MASWAIVINFYKSHFLNQQNKDNNTISACLAKVLQKSNYPILNYIKNSYYLLYVSSVLGATGDIKMRQKALSMED